MPSLIPQEVHGTIHSILHRYNVPELKERFAELMAMGRPQEPHLLLLRQPLGVYPGVGDGALCLEKQPMVMLLRPADAGQDGTEPAEDGQHPTTVTGREQDACVPRPAGAAAGRAASELSSDASDLGYEASELSSEASETRPDTKSLMTAESRHLVQAQNLAKSLPSHHQALDPAFLYDSQKQFCLDFYRPYYQK